MLHQAPQIARARFARISGTTRFWALGLQSYMQIKSLANYRHLIYCELGAQGKQELQSIIPNAGFMLTSLCSVKIQIDTSKQLVHLMAIHIKKM